MRFVVFLVTWMSLVGLVAGADAPQIVEIWPGSAPDEGRDIGAEKFLMSPV